MYQKLFATGIKLIILQLILLLIVSLLFGIFDAWYNIPSVILGGSAWVIPSWYFVVKVGKKDHGHSASAIIKSFAIGEGIKLLLSIILIIAIILLIPIVTIAFLSGYIAAITAALVLPFLMAK